MRYEIEVGGRMREVTVTRTGAAFAVTVDGRTYHVDAARAEADILSLILDNVRPTEAIVAVDRSGSGQLTITVDGIPIPVTVNGRRRVRRGDPRHAGAGPQRMLAPMPGKVVRVLVKIGDVVTARQPLVVIEAMKMENELRAARDGTVAEVHAREGESVDKAVTLVVIQ